MNTSMLSKYYKVRKLLVLFLSVSMCITAFSQNETAGTAQSAITKGVVIDASTKLPLAGIRVSVSRFSTEITKDDGSFSLKIPDVNAVLVVESPGYKSKMVPLKGRDSVVVYLYDEGFKSVYDDITYTDKKVPLAFAPQSLSTVDTRESYRVTSGTPDAAFEGKIAGLRVTPRSGTPGIGSNFFLHGVNSMFTTTQPLIIIDGLLYDNSQFGNSVIYNYMNNPLSYVDIRDVETVTLVKDATSVYGAKSANGVLIINTKRSNDYATRIDVNIYGGVNFTPKQLPMMDADQYRLYLSDMLVSKGYSGSEIQSLPYMIEDNDLSVNPDYYRYHNNTNWQDKVLKNSQDQNYFFRVSGGDEIAKYTLSLGYLNRNGIVKNTSFDRYNVRFNADIAISDRLKVSPNVNFVFIENTLMDDGNHPKSNPVLLSLVKSPIFTDKVRTSETVYSEKLEGADSLGVSNPTAMINSFTGWTRNYRFGGGININFELLKNLKINSVNGVTFDKVREGAYEPSLGSATDSTGVYPLTNRIQSRSQRLFTYYTDTKLILSNNFGLNQSLYTSLGFRYNSNQSKVNIAESYNSSGDESHNVQDGSAQFRKSYGNIGDWNWIVYYASADYSLMKKYFASATISLDGSSRFGLDAPDGVSLYGHKFGVFPSVSAAWLLSSEPFIKNDAVEIIKLRGSIGLAGNDDIGNYNSRSIYSTQLFLSQYGLVRGNIANPALEWEKVRKENLGVDVSVFHERLNVSFDFFRNTTLNMVNEKSVPDVMGGGYVLVNDGKLRNTGFDLSVSSRILNGEFKWETGLTYSMYKNKLLAFSRNNEVTTIDGANIITSVGKPVGLFYGYQTDGVFGSDAEAEYSGLKFRMANDALVNPAGGDVHFVDQNTDGIIDSKDMVVIGDPNPDFTGSFMNRFEYKGFALDVLFTFTKGNDLFNGMRQTLESSSNFYNQTQAVAGRWREQGDDAVVPKATYGDPMMNSRFSDRWIEDGSFIKLKYASLSYTIPYKSKLFRNATVFASGYNLLTFTKYLGYDPEFSIYQNPLSQGIDPGISPQYRSVYVGIKLGL
jgi:TonB-linked SusC/RagA family outer membrane protein